MLPVLGNQQQTECPISLCSTLSPEHDAIFVYSGVNNVIFLALPVILPLGVE